MREALYNHFTHQSKNPNFPWLACIITSYYGILFISAVLFLILVRSELIDRWNVAINCSRAAVCVPVEVSTYRLPLTWRQRVWRRPPWSLQWQWQWNRGWCWLSRPLLASEWVYLEWRWSPVWTLWHYFEIWTKCWAQSWSWEKLSQWSPGRRHDLKPDCDAK